MTKRKSQIETLEERRLLFRQGWDGPGLGSASLTYYLGATPENVDAIVFEIAIKTATDVWSGVADIHFTSIATPRLQDSLDIAFGEIDGPGTTLAEAYFPDDVVFGRIAGDIGFDNLA